MDENDGVTDPAVIGGVMFFYTVAGFGLLGGWKHWSPAVRALFCLVFPLHAIVASLWRDVHGKIGG